MDILIVLVAYLLTYLLTVLCIKRTFRSRAVLLKLGEPKFISVVTVLCIHENQKCNYRAAWNADAVLR